MSVSSLHHNFKAVTGMSPLQYQKRLRLQEARRLMLAEMLDAAPAAHQVGYESPSQFCREYGRLFGAPPRRDVAATTTGRARGLLRRAHDSARAHERARRWPSRAHGSLPALRRHSPMLRRTSVSHLSEGVMAMNVDHRDGRSAATLLRSLSGLQKVLSAEADAGERCGADRPYRRSAKGQLAS